MSHPRTYLDHAATSFPKPPAVLKALEHYWTRLGASPARGTYEESVEAGRLLSQCRARIAQLIGATRPETIVFTLNCTDALNLALKGLAKPSDHFITTEMDHNSILRPLNRLVEDGVVTQTRLPCDPATGRIDPDDLRRALRPNTKLFATHHASNVTGTLQPIDELARICRERGVLFLLDAAQTLGNVPFDLRNTPVDLLAAPGHKGLLGPLGTGFLYIRPGLENQIAPLREGGTGSVSESDMQPDFMPDRFESGSHNTPGIIALGAGITYILERGVESLWKHERALMRAFLDSIDGADGIELFGPRTAEGRCAVFSVRIDGFDDPMELSSQLESDFGLLTRSGLHCAPGAHATLGTAPRGGTTRISFGAMTTLEEAGFAAEALQSVYNGRTRMRVFFNSTTTSAPANSSALC